MKYFPLLRQVSFVSAGNLLNAGLGLIFLTACAKVLPVDDFGKYALITTLLVFMSKVVDFGSNSVFVAESLKIGESAGLIKRFYVLKLFLFGVAGLLSILTLCLLGFNSFRVLIVFSLGLVFYSVNVTFFAIFQSLEQFGQAVLLNTIPAGLKALFGGLVLMNLVTLSFISAFAIFALSMGLSVLLYALIPRKFKPAYGLHGSATEFLAMFKSSVPAGIAQLIAQGWPAIANTIVKLAKSFTDVGVFYLADKLANVFSLISLSIFTVILPHNARRKSENLPHDLKETVLLGVLVLLLAVGFVSVSGIFVSKLFGDKFSGSLLILDLLIIASAISAIHAFMENYFYVHDSTKTIMYISLAKLLVFIMMALVLIPVFSLKGLAISQLLSAIIGLVLVSFITVRSQLKYN